MRSSIRAYFVTLTAAAAFAVAAVFFSLWLFLDGLNPPGSDPKRHFAAVEVGESGRGVGAPINWLNQTREIAGIRDVYGARPTRVMVSHGSVLSEVGTAYVNHRHFQALGVSIKGPGFSQFEPWQRDRMQECVLAPDLAERLGDPLDTIEVNGLPCRIVGTVLSGFSGLRPPRREELWISWYGIAASSVAPEVFLERNYRAREAGIVLDGTRSLDAIRHDLQASLSLHGFDGARVMLSLGDGLEPSEQRSMVQETRRLFVATLTLIVVVGAFIVAAAGWRMERDRADLALRLVLGATKRGLMVEAVAESGRVFVLALVAGVALAAIGYRGLLWILPHSPATHVLLPQWPTLDGGWAALTSLFLIIGAMLLAQSRGIWSIPESSLQGQLRSFRSTATAENVITGAVIGIMFLATLQLASLWLEQRRLASSDGGYTNADVLAVTPEAAKTLAQAHDYRAPDVSPDPLIKALVANFGTNNVALSSALPYRPVMVSQPVVPPDGNRADGGIQVRTNHVSDGFFRLLGVSFLEGRPFNAEVSEEIVLDESAASVLLGAPPWIGGRVWFNAAAGPIQKTVVGVVANLPLLGRATEPEPTIYVPLRSLASAYNAAIRADPAHVAAVVPSLLSEYGIRAPLQPIASLYSLQREAEAFQRFRSGLVIAACVVALVLGLLGLRAVLASVFQKRQREIALKLALGARRSNLLWDLTRRAMFAAVAGACVSAFVFALASGSWLGVPNMSVGEYLRLVTVAAALLFATSVAAYLPQLRLLSQLQLSRALSSE